MSRFTGAILGAALLAVALPGVANAATLQVFDTEFSSPHAFNFRAAPGETNDVRVSEAADGSTVVSDSAPIRISGGSALDGCRLDGDGNAVCAPNAIPTGFDLGDGNDVIRYLASEPLGDGTFLGSGEIQGGAGNDTIFAGIRRNAFGPLKIFGGAGTADKVTYASATSPATVSLDGLANDGVRDDAQSIAPDIEIVEGTAFGDTITGSNADERERFIGGRGNDTITGLGGSDVFHEGSAPSGSDTIAGGGGIDLVDYSERTNRVDVRMDDLLRNDGETGEADFIDPNTNDVFGGSAGDFLVSGTGASVLIGNGGDDALFGNGGNDRVNGGNGRDLLSGGADDDLVESVDNAPDTIRCENGQDTLTRDLQDVDATGCEVVNSVGVLALAPKALTAKAGETARLRLSWTHPESWKRLRTVQLRLRAGDKVVGAIAIRPRADRIDGRGAVKVLRKSRLSRAGGKVTARLALRIDRGLAGTTLHAEVKAVDVRGRTQVERDAGTIRVAR